MDLFHKILYLSYFLICFIRESHSQVGSCKENKPVVKICTDDSVTKLTTSVFVDFSSVPTFQQTSCDCTINISSSRANFTFSHDKNHVPKDMIIKVNNAELTGAKEKNFDLTKISTISLLTVQNYSTEAACLFVSTDRSSFSITCIKNTITSRPTTLDGSGTSTGHVNNTKPLLKSNNGTEGTTIIIPIVASVSGVVCLVILIIVIIYCRRRASKNKEKSTSSSPDVGNGKEEDNDYYMTENPMYDATETQPKEQTSDNEYHYIEHDKREGRISTNHYDSAPGSPVRKQLRTMESDNEIHYAYSTPFSTNQKCKVAKANKGAIVTKKDGRSLQNNHDENMYDSADKAVANPFIGVNEYHHLSPKGSRKKAAVDIYNTTGNVPDNKHEQGEEDSDYHVTNLRR